MKNPFGLEAKAPRACKTSKNVYLGTKVYLCSQSKAAVNCSLTFKPQLDGGFYLLCPSHLEGMNCRLETMHGKDRFLH